MGLTLLVGVLIAFVVVAALVIQKQYRQAWMAGGVAFMVNTAIYRLWVQEDGSLGPARIVLGSFCLLVFIVLIYLVTSLVLAIGRDMNS
jgi:hypothetical protein